MFRIESLLLKLLQTSPLDSSHFGDSSKSDLTVDPWILMQLYIYIYTKKDLHGCRQTLGVSTLTFIRISWIFVYLPSPWNASIWITARLFPSFLSIVWIVITSKEIELTISILWSQDWRVVFDWSSNIEIYFYTLGIFIDLFRLYW